MQQIFGWSWVWAIFFICICQYMSVEIAQKRVLFRSICDIIFISFIFGVGEGGELGQCQMPTNQFRQLHILQKSPIIWINIRSFIYF